jgi:hypothetical protein
MARSIVPLWLLVPLEFHEDPAGDPPGDNPPGDNDDDGDNLTPDEIAKGDTAALLKALQEERAEKKRLARDLKTRTKAEEDKKLLEQGEVVKLKADLDARDARLKALAGNYLKDKMDSAIREEARRLKFIDVSDALGGVDRSQITVEQDEDNPADVVIDETTLKKAMKTLADNKKHLIQSGTEDGKPTGEGFGGSGKSKDKNSKEEELRKLYPNL